MIKQLLNSVVAKYRDLSVSRRTITCLSLRFRQIIDLLATDKPRYFAQPRPIISKYSTSTLWPLFTYVLLHYEVAFLLSHSITTNKFHNVV